MLCLIVWTSLSTRKMNIYITRSWQPSGRKDAFERKLLLRLMGHFSSAYEERKKDDTWLQLADAVNRSMSGGVKKMHLNSKHWMSQDYKSRNEFSRTSECLNKSVVFHPTKKMSLSKPFQILIALYKGRALEFKQFDVQMCVAEERLSRKSRDFWNCFENHLSFALTSLGLINGIQSPWQILSTENCRLNHLFLRCPSCLRTLLKHPPLGPCVCVRQWMCGRGCVSSTC